MLDMRGVSPITGIFSKAGRFATILIFVGSIAFFLGSNFVFGQDLVVPKSCWGTDSNTSPTKRIADPKTGYPIFQDNGNPETDNADYAKRKKAWIEANPEAYKKMIEDSKPTQIKQILKEEFDRMPQEKKDHILSNPKDYKVVDRYNNSH